MTSNTNPHYVLTLSCQDTRGIVADVSGFVVKQQGNIVDSAQFGDESTGRFFLRMEFTLDGEETIKQFSDGFKSQVADKFSMRWEVHSTCEKPRILLMVSKYDHCLVDILHRVHSGTLAAELVGIISNHDDLREIAEWYKVPFHHLPIEGDKEEQEEKVLDYIREHKVDLVVLARYMQILSQKMCEELKGRAINIHHSFLPSFKGARPYHQAFERGVKIIGATAHYVTSDLDEGPIIEQEVTRVDHSFKPSELTAAGRDIECSVLAKAIRYHLQHRVLLNGSKTVVFK